MKQIYDNKDIGETIDKSFDAGLKEGYRRCMEQMMKEAVDADVELILHDKTGDVRLHTGYLPKELGIKCDDKVKVIIVKEEN